MERKRPGEALPVFETGRETIFLGSTDLCLIDHVPHLAASGFAALKIEGRMKSEHYVAAVTRVYRAALDRYAEDPEGYVLDPTWRAELEAVSHRPYSDGFAFGYPKERPESLQTSNQNIASHVVVAYVEAVENGRLLLEVKHPCAPGDTLQWIGPGQAQGSVRLESVHNEQGELLDKAVGGARVYALISGNDSPLPPLAILRRPRA